MTDAMTRTTKLANLGAVVVPFLATLAAIVLFWNRIVSATDLAILAVMYLLTAAGITVGYHRLLTHRSFRTHKPIEYLFAILGSMAVQGSVIAWVADHRKHHAHTDVEGDPHSPHVGHGDGVSGVLRGLWHAHTGWLLSEHGRADWKKYAPDLYEDPGMRFINRRFVRLVVLGLALPALVGYLLTGTLLGAATGLLWGGLVRVFLVHHVTWSVNSVCHFLGTRRFEVEDHSTNVFWLALPSLGESWHHNHHAFPRSAVHGLRRWELDPSALVIRTMETARARLERDPDRPGAPGSQARHGCSERTSSRFLARSHPPLSPRWLHGRRPRRDRDPSEGVVMKRKRSITIRFGPLGLSLLAAGITAVGFAAVSLADNGNGGSGDNTGTSSGARTFQMPAPPGGAAGVAFADPNLSAADRQKLEDFRTCMEDNGAPGPPDPSKIDPSQGPPKPPSAADREKLQKAFEACKAKLPEKLRDAGPPGTGTFHCGPPPGAAPKQGQNQNQSNQSGTQSSGSTS